MKKSIFFFSICLISVLVSTCTKKTKASCTDGIKNQDEIFADCGGVCSPCETCSDGILNQNETAVDCGGVCSKCATCLDGIQNQGETGVDCGGPCGSCSSFFYSEFGTYGYNLLRDDTIHFLKAANYFTLRSQVPEGVRLKIVMKKLTSSGIWWYVAPATHLDVSIFANNEQTFNTIGKVTTDVRLNFTDEGAALIQIYEDTATVPTREKFIVWKQ